MLDKYKNIIKKKKEKKANKIRVNETEVNEKNH
jgi:hypothetical protein